MPRLRLPRPHRLPLIRLLPPQRLTMARLPRLLHRLRLLRQRVILRSKSRLIEASELSSSWRKPEQAGEGRSAGLSYFK